MTTAEQIVSRISDLENQQKEILKRIKDREQTVESIILYGNDLNNLKMRISELKLWNLDNF